MSEIAKKVELQARDAPSPPPGAERVGVRWGRAPARRLGSGNTPEYKSKGKGKDLKAAFGQLQRYAPAFVAI